MLHWGVRAIFYTDYLSEGGYINVSQRAKSFIVCIAMAIFLTGTISAIASAADEKEKGKIPTEPIKIGFVVPMSGVAASLSPNAGINAELAAEYMNKYEERYIGPPYKTNYIRQKEMLKRQSSYLEN